MLCVSKVRSHQNKFLQMNISPTLEMQYMYILYTFVQDYIHY